MRTVSLIQGTPLWHEHRATHFNASDAPAMMGVSPYKSRKKLLDELKSGVTPDVDAATQRRFDDGHRFEELARPLAEEIIGEELFPCVGVEGKFSASFDGITMQEDLAFEHKTLNDSLRNIELPEALPEHYRIQMEQQLLVSGGEGVLFMATKWNGDQLIEKRHCWYYPDYDLRARIIAGWEQFERDLETHVVEAAAPAAVGHAPDQLPALRIEAQGMVTASNLAEFKSQAMAVIESINRDLQTDDDFADAEQTVKWCKDVETRLQAAKDGILAQTVSIDEVFRTIDSISEAARAARLDLDKRVKTEKDRRKGDIIDAGRCSIEEHVAGINATMGEHALVTSTPALTAELGAAIKGKRTLSSMTDAVDTVVANRKVEFSQQAEKVRANVAILAEAGHAELFADRIALCRDKAPDDLRNLIAARIAEKEQRQTAERERIRKEEAERIEQAQRAAEATPAPQQAPEPAPQPRSTTAAPKQEAGAAPMPARVKLGDINAAIAPLSITADGLAQLGFKPVGTERAAKLYDASQFDAIRDALIGVISRSEITKKKAAA